VSRGKNNSKNIENVPHLKYENFVFIFKNFLVIFALLDPDTDPATQINADPDPDLQPCPEAHHLQS
jgi:hypothetical protein